MDHKQGTALEECKGCQLAPLIWPCR